MQVIFAGVRVVLMRNEHVFWLQIPVDQSGVCAVDTGNSRCNLRDNSQFLPYFWLLAPRLLAVIVRAYPRLDQLHDAIGPDRAPGAAARARVAPRARTIRWVWRGRNMTRGFNLGNGSQPTQPNRLSSSLQLHEVTFVRVGTCIYQVQVDAKVRLVSKYHPQHLLYGVTQCEYYVTAALHSTK